MQIMQVITRNTCITRIKHANNYLHYLYYLHYSNICEYSTCIIQNISVFDLNPPRITHIDSTRKILALQWAMRGLVICLINQVYIWKMFIYLLGEKLL